MSIIRTGVLVLRAVCLVPGSAGSPATRRQTTRATLYFLLDDGRAPIGVRRRIEKLAPGRDASGRAGGAVRRPLSGRAKGRSHDRAPGGTRLRSLGFTAEAGSVAVVDLSGLPAAQTAGALLKVRVITKVARTLIGVSGVQRIWLRADGRPWDLWDMEGDVVDRPIDYRVLLGFSGIYAAKPGTEAVSGDCFSALP